MKKKYMCIWMIIIGILTLSSINVVAVDIFIYYMGNKDCNRSNYWDVNDYMYATLFTSDYDGLIKNITWYIQYYASWFSNIRFKYAIYEAIDDYTPGNLVCQSVNESITSYPPTDTRWAGWYTLNISNGEHCYVNANTDYFIFFWGDHTPGTDLRIYNCTDGDKYSSINKSVTYNGTYPHTVTRVTEMNKASFMCYATILANETINVNVSNIRPYNEVINYYFCNDTFDFFFQINVSDGSWNNATVVINDTLMHNSNMTGNRTVAVDLFGNKSFYYDNNYSGYINVTIEGNYTNESFWFDTGDIVYCSSLSFGNEVWMLLISLVLLGYGTFKKDSVIGWITCFGATFIMFSGIYLQIIPSELFEIGMILAFISMTIGLYKAYVYLSDEDA